MSSPTLTSAPNPDPGDLRWRSPRRSGSCRSSKPGDANRPEESPSLPRRTGQRFSDCRQLVCPYRRNERRHGLVQRSHLRQRVCSPIRGSPKNRYQLGHPLQSRAWTYQKKKMLSHFGSVQGSRSFIDAMFGIRQRTDTFNNLDKFNADVVDAFEVVRQILPLPDAPTQGNYTAEQCHAREKTVHENVLNKMCMAFMTQLLLLKSEPRSWRKTLKQWLKVLHSPLKPRN